jgi:hypothetical protein
MTGRIAGLSIEGTPISEADIARIHAEEKLHADWQRRAVRVVAAAARDVADARLLLDILGLDTDVIAEAKSEIAHPKAARKRRAHAA